jgi:Cu/Ag efflux protein CusF
MHVRGGRWRWRLFLMAVCFSLALVAPQAHAQPPFAGEGRVVAVDAAQGTVTLDHGPIAGLMPAMRRLFRYSRLSDSRDFRWGKECALPWSSVDPNG